VRGWIVLAACALSAVIGVAVMTRPSPVPRPPIVRLVERLAEARRVVQKSELIDPEVMHLKAGVIAVPSGWQSVPGEIAHFVAPSPRPIHLRIDVPIEGGRDYVVKVTARDPSGKLRMLVQHAPNLVEPEPGWHKATEERAAGGRVRFDWREDTPEGATVLPIVLESESIPSLVVESFTVREAGARDPSIVEAAPAVALHGLVDRPRQGAEAVSKRGARQLLPSLLSSDDGIYEWAVSGPAELSFSTAIVPRGPAAGTAPMELDVSVQTAAGWKSVWSDVRGGDGGLWRAVKLDLPRDARGLRLSTRTAGAGRPQVVAWGNPMLRDPPRSRRHVLLLTLDAVRPDHLGAYGSKRPTSPFLDGLASRGARFQDVSAQRSHTWASTTSLLSGRFPQTSGVIARGDRPLRGLSGLASAFAAAGYTTARIGSPDLPRGQLPGFDDTQIADYDTDVMTRLEELGRLYADRPLFLWVHVSTAHYPWQVAPEFNRFDPGWSGPYQNGLSRAEFRALLDAGPVPEALRHHLTALYDGAILQMDQRLGKALAKLDDVGFFDDAIVAVTADHGAHFGEKDIWFMHATPWRASLQVPLFLIAPGQIAPGTVVRERALLVDVAPTLLDLAGVPYEDLDGVSLKKPPPDRTTVTRFDPATYVVVEDRRWKLLWNPAREPLSWPGELSRTWPLPEIALFDRQNDPNETNDVSAQYPDVVKELRLAAEADRERHALSASSKLSTEARRLLQQAGYLDEK
jgi:arylsulfatase A-like enzyme